MRLVWFTFMIYHTPGKPHHCQYIILGTYTHAAATDKQFGQDTEIRVEAIITVL